MSISIPAAPNTVKPSPLMSTVKGALVGGAIGAAGGAALSLTKLPIIGLWKAPMAAAIGGAVGLATGALIGFLKGRNGSNDAQLAVSMLPPAPPKI